MLVSRWIPHPLSRDDLKPWGVALAYAVPVLGLVVYLYVTWFAVADRYQVFLYHHDMGPGFDASPFGAVTVGRYWMTGLVASGAVMVTSTAVNLALGRALPAYQAPDTPRVWSLCALPLAVFIPALVMSVNTPTLPLANALQVTGVLLVGLGLALWLGHYAARRPLAYALLLVDGAALALGTLFLRAVADWPDYLAGGNSAALVGSTVVLILGLGLLGLMTAIYRRWRRVKAPPAPAMLVAGANVYYLALPLVHYLFFSTDGRWTDPGYFKYIPAASNYFPASAAWQILSWLALPGIAVAATAYRPRETSP